MLKKIGNLGGLFGPKSDHPLADPREVQRIVNELPADNAFRALDEVAGWLESLEGGNDLPRERLFDVVRQLDEAVQPHVRRLTRDYLNTPRLSKTEEKRLRSMLRGLWVQLAAAYEACLAPGADGRPADGLKASLPLLCCRLVAALAAVNKWDCFNYGPLPSSLWARLGQAYLAAEAAGMATRSVQLYPQPGGGLTSPAQEYVKVLVFQAASMDCLVPLEIELAERLIAHFQPKFEFGQQPQPDCIYWVDAVKGQPPMRMARVPREKTPTLRFLHPGTAHADMDALIRELEMGGEIPPAINLGNQYPVRTLLPVLKHLSACLAPVPPRRRHDRHRVKHRMAVLNGLVNAFVVFSPEFGGKPVGLQMESWVVENVSLGGFGTVVQDAPAEWLRVGALVALQPEGGDNWLLGIVRRCHRDENNAIQVGIEALGRQVLSLELKPRMASSYAAAAGIPALWIRDGNEPGEVRIVMAAGSFDVKESMELDYGGKRILLTPATLVESTADYEVARYRARVAD